ncbi:hypothetical protein [Sulfuricurvum sp.]|uniref:hypothetical protein n=1 Tax=Sulfuricurvum sp. TaxID=2025608 RepID=UPI0035679F24
MREPEFEVPVKKHHINLPAEYDARLHMLQSLTRKGSQSGAVAIAIDIGVKVLREMADENRIAYLNGFR